jgi:hypothetical protein
VSGSTRAWAWAVGVAALSLLFAPAPDDGGRAEASASGESGARMLAPSVTEARIGASWKLTSRQAQMSKDRLLLRAVSLPPPSALLLAAASLMLVWASVVAESSSLRTRAYASSSLVPRGPPVFAAI